MPELGTLKPYGVKPTVFEPLNPASYFSHQLPVSPLSVAASALADLPNKILSAYQAGRQMKAQNISLQQQRDARARIAAAMAPGGDVSQGRAKATVSSAGETSLQTLTPSDIEKSRAEADMARGHAKYWNVLSNSGGVKPTVNTAVFDRANAAFDEGGDADEVEPVLPQGGATTPSAPSPATFNGQPLIMPGVVEPQSPASGPDTSLTPAVEGVPVEGEGSLGGVSPDVRSTIEQQAQTAGASLAGIDPAYLAASTEGGTAAPPPTAAPTPTAQGKIGAPAVFQPKDLMGAPGGKIFTKDGRHEIFYNEKDNSTYARELATGVVTPATVDYGGEEGNYAQGGPGRLGNTLFYPGGTPDTITRWDRGGQPKSVPKVPPHTVDAMLQQHGVDPAPYTTAEKQQIAAALRSPPSEKQRSELADKLGISASDPDPETGLPISSGRAAQLMHDWNIDHGVLSPEEQKGWAAVQKGMAADPDIKNLVTQRRALSTLFEIAQKASKGQLSNADANAATLAYDQLVTNQPRPGFRTVRMLQQGSPTLENIKNFVQNVKYSVSGGGTDISTTKLNPTQIAQMQQSANDIIAAHVADTKDALQQHKAMAGMNGVPEWAVDRGFRYYDHLVSPQPGVTASPSSTAPSIHPAASNPQIKAILDGPGSPEEKAAKIKAIRDAAKKPAQ